MDNQSFLKSYNRRYPPDTLRQEDVLIISGVSYNLFESVYDNVVVVLKGDGHSNRNTYWCGAAATES
jgi:hypothetical protein